MLYLTMKYPLCSGEVDVVKGDQGLARKCYKDSQKMKKRSGEDLPKEVILLNVDLIKLDHRKDPTLESLTPIGDVKKVKFDTEDFLTTQIGSNLTPMKSWESYKC